MLSYWTSSNTIRGEHSNIVCLPSFQKLLEHLPFTGPYAGHLGYKMSEAQSSPVPLGVPGPEGADPYSACLQPYQGGGQSVCMGAGRGRGWLCAGGQRRAPPEVGKDSGCFYSL